MSILVTRPSPAGVELVTRLCALGRAAWSFPLIEFTPGRELPLLPQQLAALAPGDLVFALSQHAVEYAHPCLRQAGLTWQWRPGAARRDAGEAWGGGTFP